MSHHESKCGIRANIKSLRGKNTNEAYEYFRSILGEPDDIDEYEGIIEGFYYKREYRPDKEYSCGNTSDDGWFVDRIISSGNSYDGQSKLYLPLHLLNQMVREMIEKFGVEEDDIMIFSYSWYNGSDEPRHIVPPISD